MRQTSKQHNHTPFQAPPGVNNKRIARLCLLAACLVSAVFLVCRAISFDKANDTLSNVRITSEDSHIAVKWSLPLFNNADEFLLTVSDGSRIHSVVLPSYMRSYSFTDGIHGTKYRISLTELYRDGSAGEPYSKDLLFLNYDELPDFPFINITTTTFEDPANDIIDSPDELWGISVINNEYLEGMMSYTCNTTPPINSKLKICVRGNTSSVGDKKSYKLVLKNSEDLLFQGRRHADKEWLLLNAGTSLNNYVGEYLSEAVGMDWVAHGTLVNVILNGDWKGLYYLTESVKRCAARGNVSSTGYIFENDAYWWKPDTIYFKLDGQIDQTGYTFKYPNDLVTAEDVRVTKLKNYMQNISDRIRSQDPAVFDYIDIDSFAEWVLVRDLMLTGDGGGSNMYYYLYDLDENNPAKYKLHMGPVWDFDAGMQGTPESIWFQDMDHWSSQHEANWIYYDSLFQMPSFCRVYKQKLDAVAPFLASDFADNLETYYQQYGEEIEKSRALDAARWDPESYTALRDEISFAESLIRYRIDWIGEQIEGW